MDFAKGTLSHTAKENKMKEGSFAIKINGLENPKQHKFCSGGTWDGTPGVYNRQHPLYKIVKSRQSKSRGR